MQPPLPDTIIPTMKSYMGGDVIYALATPLGRSALAVFRVSGKGCVEAFAPCFSNARRLKEAPGGVIVHGFVTEVDEVVVAVYRDGRGYTGEDALEISCHGSLASISLMDRKLASLGFRRAEPGEFTLRAFMAGKIDLTQAEAVNEIALSTTRRSQLLALDRLAGSLSRRISQDRAALLEAMARVEVQLDYAEDEVDADTSFPFRKIEEAKADLDRLEATYGTGRLIGLGAKVVLAGAANAGKSSLFNLFLKQERSIVSPVPGTTRDFIESRCEMDGILVRLFDTAGLRAGGEEIEEEGMRRTRALMAGADLLVYLVDSSDPEDGYETVRRRLEEEVPGVAKLFVWNKTDLPSKGTAPEGFVQLSVASAQGFGRLVELISQSLGLGRGEEDQGLMIESPRQRKSLEEASAALGRALGLAREGQALDLVAVELKEALDQLGMICGEITSDDILERIFSTFCVGK